MAMAWTKYQRRGFRATGSSLHTSNCFQLSTKPAAGLASTDSARDSSFSSDADYFREKNPRRWRMKNLLRYQLKQDRRLALWKAENNCWYAGLSQWRETPGAGTSSRPLPSVITILEMFPLNHGQPVPPAELLTAIFECVGQPVEFERVVTLAAEVWDITDLVPESVDNPDREADRELV